ncbi:MAG TPA: LacI family DNA-binding transcriptional regulator [Baekduia sp.]|uniref:LacI family DNA-binding transcriptional regulator n=1 Tax=Baekduia sp. TaxID=2600305 RepID=UPI002D79A38D|nr:LacI family DNA-binding transcriptional regulator [Baekduia sp.]HET6505882.1 LacI family DNA-binding transcriptional regulator [Baekduia sp.]
MEPTRRPTVQDIAARAGVSKTTVSHALNGKGRVGPETRTRIMAVAAELGFEPNVHARGLATGRHMTVALQVSGHRGKILLPDSAYFIEVLNAASAAALRRGYTPMLTPSDLGADAVEGLAIDGAVIIDPTSRDPLLRTLVDTGKVVVTAGRPLRRTGEVSWVDNDHAALTTQVLDHFEARGYTRPALLTGAASRSYAHDMIRSHRDWVRARGGEPLAVKVPGPPTADAAIAAARALLSRPDRPDAIYATFDHFALGTLRVAQELGIAVPDDLGIASTVDSDALRSTSPSITAFELHAATIGDTAMTFLADRLEARAETGSLIVDAELRERGSTARKRAG